MKAKFVVYIPTDTREATAVSFLRVAGVPLFLRSILTLAASGETVFTIVAPLSHRRQVLKLWQKTIKNRQIHLNLVLTKEPHRISSDELRDIYNHSENNAFFLNANYVMPNLCGRVLSSSKTKIAHNEVLMLKPVSKKLALIGFNSELFNELISESKNYAITFEELFGLLTKERNRHYLSEVDEGIIVQKFSEIELAERLLTEHIRKNTQTFVAREINKRVSLPLSLILARLRITPNTITIFNIFIGLCAGIGAAGRTYTGVLLGAILFQTASVIDGCDGEVAKLTFRTSKFGQYIDSISDNLSLTAFIIGMMIHEYRIGDPYIAFILGGSLILGALSLIAIMSDYLKRKTDSASFVTFDKEFLQKLTPDNTPVLVLNLIKYFKIFFKKDFFSLAFLVFAILGFLNWFFYLISVGVWLGVAVLLYLRRKWVSS